MHPHLSTKRTSRSTGQTARPTTNFIIGNIPNKSWFLDSTVDNRVDKLYSLPSGSTASFVAFSYSICFFNKAKTTEITESIKVTTCHNGISLTTQTTFFIFTHIRHLLEILDELPAFTDGLVNRDTTIAIRISCLIGKFTLIVTIGVILTVLGQISSIVGLLRTAPSAITMIRV